MKNVKKSIERMIIAVLLLVNFSIFVSEARADYTSDCDGATTCLDLSVCINNKHSDVSTADVITTCTDSSYDCEKKTGTEITTCFQKVYNDLVATTPPTTPTTPPTDTSVPSTPPPPSSISLANPLGSKVDIKDMVGEVIKISLGFLGSLALLMFVYGGFLWMTSRGKTESIKQGSTTMLWAAIGIVFVFSSYGLLVFILDLIGAA